MKTSIVDGKELKRDSSFAIRMIISNFIEVLLN